MLANHKSAAKRARQTIVKTARNSGAKKTIRTFEKKILAALTANDSEGAQSLLKSYTSKMAKAARKGILHANHASRKIARLSKKVHATAK